MRRVTPLSLSLLFLAGGASLGAGGAAPGHKESAALAQRIQRIENGLRPAVVVKGEPVAVMSVPDRMRFHKTPGASVAVINGGVLEWARGYGVRETGKSEPVTLRTLFQAASISKPVAAAGALRLVQGRRLDLDEDVNRRLASWKVPESEHTSGSKVTLRGLLSHTAGLTVHGYGGYAADATVPTLEQVLEGATPANSAPTRVDIVPGSRWRYSGGGYTVLQQLLIDVTGRPFADLMRETVLQRAGMADSTFEQPLDSKRHSKAAAGHDAQGAAIEGRWHTYPEMAAAGLWTTPSDLARFAIEIQRTAAGKSRRLLSSEMSNQMLAAKLGNWGLGLEVKGSGPAARFSHGGSNAGFRASLVAYTEAGQGAVVMTNADGGGALAQEILLGIAKEYGRADYSPRDKAIARLDPSVYDAYVGVYELNEGREVAVSKGEGRLVAEAQGQRFELLPESETSFFALTGSVEVRFVKDEKGQVTHLVVERRGPGQEDAMTLRRGGRA